MFSLCLNQLINTGHQIMCVYTNNSLFDTCNISKICGGNIPLYKHQPSISELNEHISNGAEMFFVAEYPHLLPMTRVTYAINMHSSLLPNGRGLTPLPYLINQPKFSGITLHKIEKEFDSGDIILQSKIVMSSDESLTTLMIKMHLESVKLLVTLFENIELLYQNAIPQKGYSSWSTINAEQRMLNWNLSASELKKFIASFGHFGVIVKLNQRLWKATHIEVSVYQHNSHVADILFEDDNLLAISISDGFVCIHKSSVSLIDKGEYTQ